MVKVNASPLNKLPNTSWIEISQVILFKHKALLNRKHWLVRLLLFSFSSLFQFYSTFIEFQFPHPVFSSSRQTKLTKDIISTGGRVTCPCHFAKSYFHPTNFYSFSLNNSLKDPKLCPLTVQPQMGEDLNWSNC